MLVHTMYACNYQTNFYFPAVIWLAKVFMKLKHTELLFYCIDYISICFTKWNKLSLGETILRRISKKTIETREQEETSEINQG